MFINNGVVMGSSKRKMKEVEVAAEIAEPGPPAAHQINLFNLQDQHFASPNVPLNGCHSQVQQILNTAAPFKSFTTLLAAAAEEDDHRTLSTDVKNQREQIDQIITFHCDSLRRILALTLHGVAEERAAKKLRGKEMELQAKLTQNMELENRVEHYKEEAERLQGRVRYLEQAAESLRLGLRDAIAARRYAEKVEEDAESSFVDPGRVGPVRLDCKACERRLATVMVWPCRHICVCTDCDAVTKACPVCRSLKTTSVEVCLPLN
ncbi:hypothetical protein Pfo_027658 [Paulownia fortunei]|nr:hypothetical protein Pfo_027658 [Paulownia fortunei]